jgi:hypothetical protein
VFPKALQFHPLCASLWIKHARWEFDDNQNAHGARTLLQRALRVLPDCADLWVYFFKMELQYIAKLRERKRVLGLLQLKPDQAENVSKEEEDMLRLSKEEKDLLDDKDNAFLGGALPLAIYKNAISIPTLARDFQFRLNLVHSLPQLPSGPAIRPAEKAYRDMCNELAPLSQALWDSIFADFARLEECWQARADKVYCRQESGSSGQQFIDAVAVFDDAVKEVPSPKMWLLYAKFVDQLLSTTHESPILPRLCDLLVTVCKRATTENAISEDLFALWVSTLLRCLRQQEAESVLESGLAAFPQSVALWRLLLHLSSLKFALPVSHEAKEHATPHNPTRGKRKAKSIEKQKPDDVLASATLLAERVAPECELWKRARASRVETILTETLELLLGTAAIRNDQTLPHAMFREAVIDMPHSQMKCRYVDWAVQIALCTTADSQKAVDAIRKVVDWVLIFPGPSLLLYNRCLEAERRCPAQNHQRLRQLLESSLSMFPTETGLWLQYLQMEKGQAMDAVYWRARKALPAIEQDRLSAEYAHA